MDFVDLDRVLDEFEEEEKQALSIIPGHELKPSGYKEFLEKHQEQDWECINSSVPYSSSSGYTQERLACKEPAIVSYDEPYEGPSPNKLSSISDQGPSSITSLNGHERSPDGKVAHQSEIVTNLSRVSTNGEPVSAVYSSLNGCARKGIANRSERKGTIACQATEVQTDALSPASEEELMSSPFPRTDIIIDGHGDTSVFSAESAVDSAGEQNHSPIYASMDPANIVSAGSNSSQTVPSSQGFVREDHSSESITHSKSGRLEKSEYPSLASGAGISEGVVGFGDPDGGDLDEDEVNMYLEELTEGVKGSSALSSVNYNASSEPSDGQVSSSAPDVTGNQQPSMSGSDLVRNLADGLSTARPEKDSTYKLQSESLPKKFCPDKSVVRQDGHQDPDLVAGLEMPSQPLSSAAQEVSDSDTQSRGASENSNRNIVFSSIMEGRMEIESVLEDKDEQQSLKASIEIGEKLLQGKMEIEDILDEAIHNHQQSRVDNDLHDSDNRPNKVTPVGSDVTQPDVTVASTEQAPNSDKPAEPAAAELGRHSLDPAYSSPGQREPGSPMFGVGARPKDPSAIKKNRPNSLLGLSKVNLDFPAVVKEVSDINSNDQTIQPTSSSHSRSPTNFPDVTQPAVIHRQTEAVSIEPQVVDDSKQRMNRHGDLSQGGQGSAVPVLHDFTRPNDTPELVDDGMQDLEDPCASPPPEESGLYSTVSKTKRPTSLNLPHRPGFDEGSPSEEETVEQPDTDQSSISSNGVHPGLEEMGDEVAGGAEGQTPALPPPLEDLEAFEEDSGSALPQQQQGHSTLGYERPFWIPDANAPACMLCQTRFTMWKRRHHCRGCGKVLCSGCCSLKALLPYLDNKEARVCLDCHTLLSHEHHGGPVGAGSPNPNNPTEYCSKVPPSQQASGNSANPPVVMVPTGVLKTSGSQKKASEPKQVMFSDGIRPGGDLTELDGPDQTRRRRSARAGRKSAASTSTSSTASQESQRNDPPQPKTREESLLRSPCLVPEAGLPPLYIMNGESGVIETDEVLTQLDYTSDYKSEDGPMISFAVNKNLSVGVKIINMDCCVNRWCWCFVTRGMCTVGQAELVVLLELSPEEAGRSDGLVPPTDMFLHFHFLYTEALKGNFVCDMGHTILNQTFLGNKDHGGFLYLQPTFQCMTKLPVPESPYLFGVLLQKWEVPWAKVFPIRLMLRLGAEYRYYPCPLVSVCNRKPVFFEIGHTIINLLADFRNYQYMLTQIKGVTIHMENKKTVISFPRNRYNDVMKVVCNSNEHVMALGSSFSSEADSHLVCIQSEDGNYQTQAINIQNKPRLVTGASFVVFNGALKASTGLRAKSSIVEDGLMVQVLPETLASLKQALVDMAGFTIQCGPADVEEPEESVHIKWVDNDKGFNLGVKSYLDETSLEGVESVSVKCPVDILGTGEGAQGLAIRWTRVYFLQHDDGSGSTSHFDPVDLSRLTEDIAQACCTALARHLGQLKQEGQIKLGLRVNLTRDAVGYEMGSKGKPLPPAMVSDLDTYLVPIVHQSSEEGIIMELVFNIVD